MFFVIQVKYLLSVGDIKILIFLSDIHFLCFVPGIFVNNGVTGKWLQIVFCGRVQVVRRQTQFANIL